MKKATLSRKHNSDGTATFIVDCKHGTTTVDVLTGDLMDTTAVSLAVTRHYAEEGCACTKDLRRRYLTQ